MIAYAKFTTALIPVLVVCAALTVSPLAHSQSRAQEAFLAFDAPAKEAVI